MSASDPYRSVEDAAQADWYGAVTGDSPPKTGGMVPEADPQGPVEPHLRLRDVVAAWVDRDGPQHYTRQVHPEAHYGVREVMREAEVAHRLLDWAKVPDGPPQSGGDLDTRTAYLVNHAGRVEGALSAIAAAHTMPMDSAGGVTGYCHECDHRWPCPTYAWATGERTALDPWHPDDDDEEQADAPPAVQGPAKLPGNSPAPDAERGEQA